MMDVNLDFDLSDILDDEDLESISLQMKGNVQSIMSKGKDDFLTTCDLGDYLDHANEMFFEFGIPKDRNPRMNALFDNYSIYSKRDLEINVMASKGPGIHTPGIHLTVLAAFATAICGFGIGADLAGKSVGSIEYIQHLNYIAGAAGGVVGGIIGLIIPPVLVFGLAELRGPNRKEIEAMRVENRNQFLAYIRDYCSQ